MSTIGLYREPCDTSELHARLPQGTEVRGKSGSEFGIPDLRGCSLFPLCFSAHTGTAASAPAVFTMEGGVTAVSTIGLYSLATLLSFAPGFPRVQK